MSGRLFPILHRWFSACSTALVAVVLLATWSGGLQPMFPVLKLMQRAQAGLSSSAQSGTSRQAQLPAEDLASPSSTPMPEEDDSHAEVLGHAALGRQPPPSLSMGSESDLATDGFAWQDPRPPRA